ncbi:hypothetical protein DSTSK_41710 [Desulforhabdus sp. TSK]|nr:hypothetical protein DSTSK_41710 [Desulforhabdus sp. TSK]
MSILLYFDNGNLRVNISFKRQESNTNQTTTHLPRLQNNT